METPETPPEAEWALPIDYDEFDGEDLVFLPIKKWRKNGNIYECTYPDCNYKSNCTSNVNKHFDSMHSSKYCINLLIRLLVLIIIFCFRYHYSMPILYQNVWESIKFYEACETVSQRKAKCL